MVIAVALALNLVADGFILLALFRTHQRVMALKEHQEWMLKCLKEQNKINGQVQNVLGELFDRRIKGDSNEGSMLN